jgi:hypothetical protein
VSSQDDAARLSELLKTFDVPGLRRDTTALANLVWLKHNITPADRLHPDCFAVVQLIDGLLRERGLTVSVA